MFKKFNNNLFQKRAQKYLNSAEREHRFVSYDKARTVFLLFESDFSEKNPNVRTIIQTLQQDGKKVVAWGFVNKKEVMSSILLDFRILNLKQLDFTQRPITSYINELKNMEFDLLIDLSLHPMLPIEYLAVYTNASCKTGLHKNDLPVYDFMLDLESMVPPEDETENKVDEMYLFNQIIFYLKSIQTND
jgi:hypothetical protein